MIFFSVGLAVAHESLGILITVCGPTALQSVPCQPLRQQSVRVSGPMAPGSIVLFTNKDLEVSCGSENLLDFLQPADLAFCQETT